MKASFDKTYCTSKKCKCERHESNYEFEEDKLYWFMEKCEKSYENHRKNVEDK